MKKRTFTEKNNDALLFWQYLGGPIYWVIGVVVVALIFAAGFGIKKIIDRHETQQEQKLADERQDIADRFIANNPDTFGTITKQWMSGSFYYVENENGKFTIAFKGQVISKVFFENEAGFKVLYEREES